ncbi:hypothetical protein ACFWEJ_22815, partial [Promicromonospora sp. NPDC060204]|uniref:hypothetical protein n=1 Tax=Promicromonospora sp. NPDC060204 TaxID=3347071 RepID=UPI00365E7D13
QACADLKANCRPHHKLPTGLCVVGRAAYCRLRPPHEIGRLHRERSIDGPVSMQPTDVDAGD